MIKIDLKGTKIVLFGLVIVLVVLVLGIVIGLWFNKNPGTLQEAIKDEETLGMKVQCSKLFDEFWSEVEKDTDEYNIFSSGSRSQTNVGSSVCYSSTRNTCVASYEVWTDDTSGDGEWWEAETLMKEIVAVDLLTREDVFNDVLFKESFGIEGEVYAKRDLTVDCVN